MGNCNFKTESETDNVAGKSINICNFLKLNTKLLEFTFVENLINK